MTGERDSGDDARTGDGESGATGSDHSRRRVMKLVGASSVAGLSGLSGYADPTAVAQQTTTQGGDWPDLSGTEVHFLTDESSEAFTNFFQRVKSDFERDTGATVNLDLVNLGEQGQRLAQLLQAGDPPDVMQAVQTRVVQLQHQGVAAPVNSAMSDMLDRYGEPVGGTRVQVDGDDYGVPCWINPSGQWYREDIYNQEPTDWDTMLAQAEQADDPNGTRGTSIPLAPALCNDSFFLAYLYTNEGRVCARDDNGQVQCVMDQGDNRQRWIETLEFLGNLYQYSPTNANAGCSQQVQAIPTGTSAEAGYVGARPKVQSVQQDVPFADQVRASFVPSNRTSQSHANSIAYMTFQGANTEAANTFVSYMFQERYFIDLLLLTPIHNNPSYPSIRENQAYQQGLNQLSDAWTDQDVETSLAFADEILPFSQETSPPNPYAGTIYSSKLLVDILNDATINERDPAAIVDDYAGQIQSVIDQSRG
ncbi:MULTISPECIES: ABC transporter substrate-binding protein [Halorussus]|uniref:ABC transporter substrate-binding protein n=1 Tax=Halorussus TaxID=1070314 RepID=UPI000E213820|nr:MULTISPECIES: extracellular solute-binding protein [Halorussus]NHN58594.1 extracellular solute-binding protein [Halorussus sp. JP-T4]